ncbi:glycine betaine ABC transporter substrate-binding protein [Allocoleopsis franciscana]|uniref:Periplasmic glycine betaine/choline-binding (Lipo)protein of an ABC-type transport system (Osmoprotectant binding protein) n=1 Tax=Allocoleopsis franciscana PCC 7113 TaxID=1173027 RepID=K9W986_9CYAN|nr:periplasmic glycine betaine/choline-binding (lipo)protein of an ABC-type transport system (osmoprotectant binding protein) [Allocoleopsis franciscana PCC 7113]
MQFLRRLVVLLLLTLLTMLSAIACNSSTGIKVGSKDFTEQFILGEMYALVLENQGLKVERKLNLGGTPVAQAGLESGQIDLYPEYTGTGLLTVIKQPAQSNQKSVFNTVAKAYREKFNLVWLEPAPMNNTQALVMTQEGSKKYGIKTISQMVAKASQLTMIGPPEFEAREDGLPGLKKAYGDFKLKKFIPADPGLRYKTLNNAQADVAVAFGTDGEISALKLVVLEDDKNLFPPYQVAPVIRQETLDQNPGIRDALNTLSPKLTTETMQRLNYEVSGKQREPAEVAKEFLTQEGLLKKP